MLMGGDSERFTNLLIRLSRPIHELASDCLPSIPIHYSETTARGSPSSLSSDSSERVSDPWPAGLGRTEIAAASQYAMASSRPLQLKVSCQSQSCRVNGACRMIRRCRRQASPLHQSAPGSQDKLSQFVLLRSEYGTYPICMIMTKLCKILVST
ncbi:uncharacterized protein LOC124680103 [Lolium rigidum]|uniref:uncharacterized protein LOC124680103 n=1 Tax=Lolium rigidum TaxID=89674 RepID=UPI001F5DEF7B|nr:uncharacterized protein LOC124680103 [Lolium rigidum]